MPPHVVHSGEVTCHVDDRDVSVHSADFKSCQQACSGVKNPRLYVQPSCNGMRVGMLEMLQHRGFGFAPPLKCGDPREAYGDDEIVRATLYLCDAYEWHRSRPPSPTTGRIEWWSIAMPLKFNFQGCAHMAGLVLAGFGSDVTVYQVDTERYEGHDFAAGYTVHQQQLIAPFLKRYGLACGEWIFSVCRQDKPQCEGWTSFYCALASVGYVPSEVESMFGGCRRLEDIMESVLTVPLTDFAEKLQVCERTKVGITPPLLRACHVGSHTAAKLLVTVQALVDSPRTDLRSDYPLLIGKAACPYCVRAAEYLQKSGFPFHAVDVEELSQEAYSGLLLKIRRGDAVHAHGIPCGVSDVAFASGFITPANQKSLALVLTPQAVAEWSTFPLVFMPPVVGTLQFVGGWESCRRFFVTRTIAA